MYGELSVIPKDKILITIQGYIYLIIPVSYLAIVCWDTIWNITKIITNNLFNSTLKVSIILKKGLINNIYTVSNESTPKTKNKE